MREVKTMGAGVALNTEQKERIKALLAIGKAKNQIAKELKISWATVDKVSKENPDEVEKLRDDKKQMMIDNIWASLVDAQELGHSMIKEAKEGRRDIPLNQISTYYGTLYDKMALMNGESTQNIGGGMVISIGIPDKAEE
jgi:hypothetical protein